MQHHKRVLTRQPIEKKEEEEDQYQSASFRQTVFSLIDKQHYSLEKL